MKSFTFLLLSLPVLALSWVPVSRQTRVAFAPRTRLQVSNAEFDDTEKPCWQDIWNYDCTMSTAYSAAFIPADWIKKLPCALGLAVRIYLLMILNSYIQ
jgi:hypothetical protein